MTLRKAWMSGLLISVLLLTFNPARAETPDLGLWVGKWFKITETFSGYGLYDGTAGITSSKGSRTRYLKITGVNGGVMSCAAYEKTEGAGWITQPIDLNYIAGHTLDFVSWYHILYNDVDWGFFEGYALRMQGRKNGETLSSATIKSIGGFGVDWGTGEEVEDEVGAGSITIKGTLIPESKLPPDIPKDSSDSVYIDAFQFSGTSNYCCWTSGAYAWFGSNFLNPGSSFGDPSNARNAPDGEYAVMRAPGYSLITGTDAISQTGIKVYIAPGNTGTYEVYGGNIIPTSLCSYGTPYYTCDLLDLGHNPQNYGFTYLGMSNITQEFPGGYLYYIVKN